MGTEPGWVVLEDNNSQCVFNERYSTFLHTSSDEVNQELCQLMKEKGAKIIQKIPEGEIKIE